MDHSCVFCCFTTKRKEFHMAKERCCVKGELCDCSPATRGCTKRIDSGKCNPSKKETKALLSFGERNGKLAEAMRAMQIASARWEY